MEHRSETIWERRDRSSVICKDTYLLACCRYVELNPIRACMALHPSEYHWSSYREKTSETPLIIDPDPAYIAMSADESQRKREYEKWVLSSIPEGEWECIRGAIQRGHLTGKDQLEEEVAKRLGIRLEMRKPGRPRKI
jgi:putative transposase